MTAAARAKTLIVSLIVLFCLPGCSDDDSGGSQTGLPPNPADWVCGDSLAVATQAEIDAWCASHPDRGQPLPEVFRNPPPLSRLEEKNLHDLALEVFVKAETYKTELGWLGDTTWRFTGPYVGEFGSGSSYGTHLPVRIYYSPEVIDWLCEGRQGELPEGAMIIKEMHLPDDKLDVSVDDEGCMVINADVGPEVWAMMIKNSEHSFDHWYWPLMQRSLFPLYPEERVDPPIVDRSAFPSQSFVDDTPISPDPAWYPTGYYSENPDKIPNVINPQNAYSTFCISCHASAENESSFASLDNLIGTGIRYKLFEAAAETETGINGTHALVLDTPVEEITTPFTVPLADADPAFLAFYDQLPEVTFSTVWESRLPAQTYDHAGSSAGGPTSFLTADQCAPCHDSLEYLADQANMLLRKEVDGKELAFNLSPFGEWNASPMGLAGRDPIFFAQLESETNHLSDLAECIETTCLHCHAAMGQRQLAADTPNESNPECESLFGVAPPPGVPSGRPFRLDMVAQWPGADDNRQQEYAALARDGISCTVCHRISPEALGSENSFTGNFVTGPLDEIYGPYEQVSTKPMQNALGITPLDGDQIADADLCGSCHNILLPVFTNEGTRTGFSYEQTTHLEWLNSDYASGRKLSQTCQDCHMPRTFDGEPLSFIVANFESNLFPPTTHRLPDSDITAVERDLYSRHSLHGLNVFLNQMFQQFPLLLGYRQAERYTRLSLNYPPLLLSEDSMIEMAQEATANVEVRSLETTPEGLRAVVRVTNRTGHYLPSGVGFRRVLLEVQVRDAAGEVLWASGRTNALGAVVAGTSDDVLPTEQPLLFPDPGYQPHYQVITRQDQAQIYQEIVEDSQGDVTTSFLRRVKEVKDNRIRPTGYDPNFYLGFDSPYIQALAQIPGQAKDDPDYTDPQLTGADQIEYRMALDAAARARADNVVVTLYSQSIPPPYLAERFNDANQGAAEKTQIDRLYYMTSHFRTDATTDANGDLVLKDWKLFVSRATRQVQ